MLVRWNPWSEISRMENDLLALFNARNTGFAPLQRNGDPAKPVSWHPAVDVHEDGSRILLAADLPGVNEKDLSLHVENNVLTISGERTVARPRDGEGWQHLERVAGTFARSFTLPPVVDAANISAELKHGVLTVTLPKRAEAQPRQIKVSVGS